MNRREPEAAGQEYRADAGADAKTAVALCELGHRHLEAGCILDAQMCCQQALAADATCAEAMHLMGLLSLHANQADHAIEWFARAVRHDEKSAHLLSLGNLLKHQRRLDDAFRALNRAVEIDIDSPQAWKALAQLLAELNRREEATLAFQHVLKLDPEDADAAHRAGLLLLLAGKQEEALGFFDRSDRLRPNHAPTQRMRALALARQDRALFEETLSEMDRTPAVDPDTAYIHNDVGEVCRRSGRHEEALIWFERALNLRPDYPLARSNKAYSLARLHRFDEALANYAALKAVDPAGAEWNQALLQLLLGNFEAGWAGREARWKVPSLQLARYNFSQPMWLGKEPIAGKTILIYQEEGLGDTIQFARYVPMVAAQGARVILMVADTLVPLLSKLPDVIRCIPRSVNPALEFDTHCGITSLPLTCATTLETIPSAVPYLPAPDPVRVRLWEERLGPRQKLRVGLVWSGNPGQSDDHNRSMPLSKLSPLLDLDATFVSLQKDPRPGDRELLARTRIIDLTAHLTDFAETAALVACLDLVISVCTSTAHLAGALACPTWILLPHTPDWRWLLHRDDSPWYPTARLFRQDDSRDYTCVIERVQVELRERIASWSPNPLKGKTDPLSPADPAAPSLVPDDADGLHLRGLQSLQEKQFDQAVEWLSRAIRRDPKPQYVLSLGHALKQQGRVEEALKAFDKAVELDVESPVAWKALAQTLSALNRHHEAALAFQHVFKLDPRDADAAYQAGFLFFRAGKLEDALAQLDRAEPSHPDHAPSLQMRALVIGSLGRSEEAVALLSRAHALLPEDADICNNMGVFLQRLGRQQEALTWFDKSLARRPDFTAAYQAGLLLIHADKPQQALAYLDRADQLRPDHAPTLQARATAIGGLDRFEEAVALLARAHALAPEDPEICNSMGVALQRLERLEEALTWFDRALARRPNLVSAFTNKGFTLGHLHRFDEALAVYAALKVIAPDNVEAEWCASLLHLLIGNLEIGWAGREARWKLPEQPLARYGFSQPMWLGKQPIHGKTILIHQDEGLGDVIQFVRYVPILVSLGARVILLVDDALVSLLSKIPGVLECLPKSAHSRVTFDVHCAITSLPLAFNTSLATIPSTVPYLPAPEEARRQIWERRLGPYDRMRVGLVWSGNPKQANDRYRSITLRDLSPLRDLDATFVSLQKDPRPADQAALREWPGLVDLTVHLTDFAETAALVSCLDLVISVCTSTAHLAGALGCPTWVLLSYTPDWRWLLDRDDSPWYPTARLFRQDESRNYGGVIKRVRGELAERIAAWCAQKRG
jgi:tetratricopeptide (TPR) repeat protein